MPKRLLIPVSIVLLAFCLRLFMLNVRPIWYDEANTVLIAEQDIPDIVTATAADTMPPLYYVLLHYWLPFAGTTPLAMRMLSVVLSSLGVALVYAVGKRGVSSAVGEWAAFFSALAPFQVYYAQELRMYSLLALAGLLYMYSVMRLHERTAGPVLGVAVSGALALYSHNLAFLTLVAANLYLALRRDWSGELRLAAGQGLALLLFLPWLPLVPGQVVKIQRAFWTQPPGLVDILQLVVQFTNYLPLPAPLLAVALFLTLSIVAFAGIELRKVATRGRAIVVAQWLFFAVVPVMLMFLVSYVIRPIFIPRGVILSALAFYLLLAAVAASARYRVRVGIALTAIIIAAINLPFLYSAAGEWRRAPFAQADQYLREQYREGDLIVHDNKLSFFPMHLNDSSLPQEYLPDPPGSSNDTLARATQESIHLLPVDFDTAVRSSRRLWFIIFQTALDQAEEDRHPHGNLSRLDAALTRGPVTTVGDLRIFLYEPR